MQILVIDEDEAFSRGIRYSLQREGHRVFAASDSSSVLPLLGKYKPELIILDKDLLEIDGLRPFAAFDAEADMPLILLVAHPEEGELVEEEPLSERIGAFRPGHLHRAEAILRRLRRSLEEEPSSLEIGRLNINFDRKQAAFYDQPLPLSPTQFKLMGSLALHAGRVVGFQELLENVWGYQGEDSEARELLKVHINRIRKKMRIIAEGGERYLQSVRGFGYMLSPPDS